MKKYLTILCIGIISCIAATKSKPEEVAYSWIKASILGDTDSLDKYTDWIEIIEPNKRKTDEAFQLEKQSILEGNAYWSDVLREDDWFPHIIPSIKMDSIKTKGDESIVFLKFNTDSIKIMNVTLQLKRENGIWKVYKSR
jgi:hypothetical protein